MLMRLLDQRPRARAFLRLRHCLVVVLTLYVKVITEDNKRGFSVFESSCYLPATCLTTQRWRHLFKCIVQGHKRALL